MTESKPNRVLLAFSIATACSVWPAAVCMCVRSGEKAFAISMFLLGLSLGPCLAAYALAPRLRKQAVRRLILLTGGLSILAFPLLGAVNLDLEGFFMLLLLGTGGAAIGHTLITVIAGPLLFGRVLCGWGCWRSMILEMLPMRRSPGRRDGKWNLLPILGLAASLAAAALSVFVLGDRPGGVPGNMHSASVRAAAVTIAIYYAASAGLAFAWKDKRAFCKYLCPSSVILGLTARFSVVKMASHRGLCNACGACSRICPMDIDVARFAVLGQRVLSGQCILCQNCAHVCPTGALHLSAGFDLAGRTPFLTTRPDDAS